MSIMEQLDAYRALLDKKEQLAEAVKENNRAIEAARDALADSMVSEETMQIVRDGYSYTLTPKTKYSKAAGQDEALMDALRSVAEKWLHGNKRGVKVIVPASGALAASPAADVSDELRRQLDKISIDFTKK